MLTIGGSPFSIPRPFRPPPHIHPILAPILVPAHPGALHPLTPSFRCQFRCLISVPDTTKKGCQTPDERVSGTTIVRTMNRTWNKNPPHAYP